MKCKLCEREASADLCRYHQEAREEVESAYPYWKEAYGSLAWSDYLDRIVENGETGEWASEVAKMMRSGDGGSKSEATGFKS